MNQSKMKTLLKYQLRDYSKSILIMYLCVYLVLVILVISGGTTFKINGKSSNGGFEMISMITIFVIGLCSFKDNFKFFSANGVSRKTQFYSTVAALGVVSTIFAFVDTVNSILFTHIMVYRPMLILFYGPRFGYSSDLIPPYSSPILTPQILAESFLWLCFAYFFMSMIGLFITTLFYRMSKAMKIAVSVSFTVIFLNGIPFLDQFYFGGILTKFFHDALNMALGYANGYNPYIGMFSMFLFAAIFAALAYLLARKACVRE